MGHGALRHEPNEQLSSALERNDQLLLPLWAWGILLAAMPALSFGLQFWFSSEENTLPLLFGHYTVSYVDWLFVPFNFLVVYAVNWRHGGSLLVVMVFSLAVNAVTHAYWQYALVENPGHMFGRNHVILRAGWVHVCYGTIQMTLILAFLFVRQQSSRHSGLLTCVCVVYFISAGISGYVMNNGFMTADVIMVVLGLALTLIYPRLALPRQF